MSMQIGRHSATFVSTSLETAEVSSRRNAHKSPLRGLKSLKNKGRSALHLPVLFYCLDFIFTATVRECCFPAAIVSFFLSLFQPLPLSLLFLSFVRAKDEMKRTCAAKIFDG